MSYNTPAQFFAYSIASGSFSSVPADVVQHYLDVAQAEIDSALVVHHGQPGQAIFPSGSLVPASVLEAERVIAAYRLFQFLGYNPDESDKAGFLPQRYQEIVGTPDNPATGWLGQLATGTRALVNPANGDQLDTQQKPSLQVFGQAPRGWQQSDGSVIE